MTIQKHRNGSPKWVPAIPGCYDHGEGFINSVAKGGQGEGQVNS